MRQWADTAYTLTHNDAILNSRPRDLAYYLEAFKRYGPETDILPGIT